MKDIAKELQLHPRTISAEIDWAKREGLFEQARERALGLSDKALRVYEKALDMALKTGDIEAARDIVHGLGILTKNGTAPIAPVSAETAGGLIATLDEYRVRRMTIKAEPKELVETAEVIDAEAQDTNSPTTEADTTGSASTAEPVAARPRRVASLLPPPVAGEYPSGS